ncbi:MAG: hypothetical protein ABIZ34_03160, partial [Candidatus Limnocylindrales bacterium]
EKDFELRREGDVLGLVQSGLPTMRVASLQRKDHQLLAVEARHLAESLVGPDGALIAGRDALAAELDSGWLARIFSGEPASGT